MNRYGAYCVNGYKFQTSTIEEKRATQNNGIVTAFNQECYSSSRDANPIEGRILYYGQLQDIVEIFYGCQLEESYIMFNVRWCDKASKDEYGFQTVNLNKEIDQDEPFIFARQAEQCFYIKDAVDPNLWVVLRKPPRSFFEQAIEIDNEAEIVTPVDIETEAEHVLDFFSSQDVRLDDDTSQVRIEVPDVIMEPSRTIRSKSNKKEKPVKKQ